jgi:hypothetical protein
MYRKIDELSAILTSFAYGEEYLPELEGMLPTVRKHHPTWHLVTGRGVKGAAFEVESPQGNRLWTLPVPFEPDGSLNDWMRPILLKAWWVAQVWDQFRSLGSNSINRVIWLDADARLNGPLDILLEPEKEAVVGVWGGAEGTEDDHMTGGFLVFQGSKAGVVESIINEWSKRCLALFHNPPPDPQATWHWGGGDQEVLTTVLSDMKHLQFTLCKLMDYDKYCGEADFETGLPKPGALIDQWQMSRRVRKPHKKWPPPESARYDKS